MVPVYMHICVYDVYTCTSNIIVHVYRHTFYIYIYMYICKILLYISILMYLFADMFIYICVNICIYLTHSHVWIGFPAILTLCLLLKQILAMLRTALILLLVSIRGGAGLLEQPQGSMLHLHPRIRWLFRTVGRVLAKHS